MTRTLTFTAHGGRLAPRQLPGQHAALTLLEVPTAYSDTEVLAIARAVADGRRPPLEHRLSWGELVGLGLAAGVLGYAPPEPAPARAPRKTVVRRRRVAP